MNIMTAGLYRNQRSTEELRLAAELETSGRRIIELMSQLAETSRSRDELNDRMQAMTWSARWGREHVSYGML